MASASIIHSAIWLALVACYDPPPDIQLQVTRTQGATNVSVQACDDLFVCSDKLTPFGVGGDLQPRKVAIYVNDDREVVVVVLKIVDATPPTQCYRVTLTDSMIVREVHLNGPTYWQCPAGTADCEVTTNCL